MAGPDLSVVTAVIDFGTVVSAVVAVSASWVVVLIAWKGAKMILRSVDGGSATVPTVSFTPWDNFFGERRMSRADAEGVMARARESGIDEGQIRSIAKRAIKEGRWS